MAMQHRFRGPGMVFGNCMYLFDSCRLICVWAKLCARLPGWTWVKALQWRLHDGRSAML